MPESSATDRSTPVSPIATPRTVPNPLHVLTYPVRCALAWLGGYFWLPCPLCGRKFAGFEWRDRGGKTSTIPRDASPSMGQGICPTCTSRGLGYNEWNIRDAGAHDATQGEVGHT